MASNADREVNWKFKGTNELSGPALEAAQALQKLRDKISDDTKALRDLSAQMKNLQIGKKLQGENLVALDSFKTLKKAIDERKSSITAAQSQIVKMGGHVGQAIPPRAIAQFEQMAEAARSAGGPVGQLGGAFEYLRKLLDSSLGVYLAIAVAIAGVVIATKKLIGTIYEYSTAQANARRAELLRLEGLGRLRTMTGVYLGVHNQSGTEIQKTVDRLSRSYAVGRDQLIGYAAELHHLNLRGKQFESAMEGMAMKSSVHGDAAAHQFAQWAAYYNYAGKSVDTLTNKVRSQIGGVARLQMLDANVQAAKLQESFDAIAAGVDVEPLLRAKAAFNDVFSQATASGEYLKTLWGRLAQPINNFATWAWELLRTLFLRVILITLQTENVVRRVFNGFLRVIINSGLGKLWPIIKDGFERVRGVVMWLDTNIAKMVGGSALLAIAVIFGAIAAAALISASVVVIVVTLVGLLIKGVVKLWGWLTSINWKKLGLSFVDLGVSLVHGLLRGIANMLSTVINAVKRLGKSVWTALKDTLKSSSPSRLFAELGTTIPLGVALGITTATPAATQAMQRSGDAVVSTGANALASPMPLASPSSVASPASSAAADGGGKNVTIEVGGITVQVGNEATARSIAGNVGDELATVLEALALQLGGGATPKS